MFTYEFTLVALVLDLDEWFSTFVRDFEGPMFCVFLDFRLIELSTNESFGVKDSVLRIIVECVFRRITDTRRRDK